MAANRSSSEAVLTLLAGDKDWIRFIAEARNALSVNHARQNFVLEVQNFKLQPGNKFSGPSWRHDLSDRGGPVQEYWSDIIKDMNTHMHNMLTFLEEVYILCILDRCDRRLPFEFAVYRKPEDDISKECPVLYVAQVTPASFLSLSTQVASYGCSLRTAAQQNTARALDSHALSGLASGQQKRDIESKMSAE
jgi:hypothetical protein